MGAGQQDAPPVFRFQENAGEFFWIRWTVHQAQVQKSLVQQFPDTGGITAENPVADAGMLLGKTHRHLGDEPDDIGFPGTQVNIPGNLRGSLDFGPGFSIQFQQFLRPLPEQDSFRGQGQMPVLPVKQGLAHFLFQGLQLPGQGGLGDVDTSGRLGNVALLGD